MLTLEFSASDLSLVFDQACVGIVLSVPFAMLITAIRGGASRMATRRRGRRLTGARQRAAERARCGPWTASGGASAPHAVAGYERWDQAATPPALGALDAVQLRRAASVVQLFSVAPPGGEKEAAYHALVRLAMAARGQSPTDAPITPGAFYRHLTERTRLPMPGWVAMTFDVRTCAELEWRDHNLEYGSSSSLLHPRSGRA